MRRLPDFRLPTLNVRLLTAAVVAIAIACTACTNKNEEEKLPTTYEDGRGYEIGRCTVFEANNLAFSSLETASAAAAFLGPLVGYSDIRHDENGNTTAQSETRMVVLDASSRGPVDTADERGEQICTTLDGVYHLTESGIASLALIKAHNVAIPPELPELVR